MSTLCIISTNGVLKGGGNMNEIAYAWLAERALQEDEREKTVCYLQQHISAFLKKNDKIIKRIDENLDNKSCDGEFNRFVFAGKEIQSLNIEEAGQEKKVLNLFYSVAEELKGEGIMLSLREVKIPDNIKRAKEAKEDWWNGVEIIGLKK